jgi:hypothetical protein
MAYEIDLPDGSRGLIHDNVPRAKALEAAQRAYPDAFPPPPTALGQALNAPRNIARGVGSGLVQAVGGLSSLPYAAARYFNPEMTPFAETGFGKSITETEQSLAPTDEGLGSQFAHGLGTFGSMLGPQAGLKGLGTVIKGVAPRAAAPVAVAQTAGLGAEEARQRVETARAEGQTVTPGQEFGSLVAGVPAGLTELLPIQNLFRATKGLSKASDLTPLAYGKRALQQGAVEGVQEAGSGALQDIIAQQIYNPDQEIGGSALKEGAMGAGVGGVAQVGLDLVLRKDIRKAYQASLAKKDKEELDKAMQAAKDTADADAASRPKEKMAAAQDKHPIYNPLGNFSAQKQTVADDGTTTQSSGLNADHLAFINKTRAEAGKPLLKSFSVEDLSDAGMPQQEISNLIAEKMGFVPSDTDVANAPQHIATVLNIAGQKNVDTDSQGFRDFLRRSTGTDDLNSMSPPQLFSAIKAVSALPISKTPLQLAGTSATRFSEEQYDVAIKNLNANHTEDNALSLADTIEKIKGYTGLKNDVDAESLLHTAAGRGDLYAKSYPNPDGTTNISVHIPNANKVAGGPDVRENTYASDSVPESYVIKTSQGDLEEHATEDKAKSRIDTLSAARQGLAVRNAREAAKLGDQITQSQTELDTMAAQGLTNTIEYQTKAAGLESKNRAKLAKIDSLNAAAENLAEPLTIEPRGEKITTKSDYTLYDNNEAAGTFDSREEAQAHAVSKLPDDTLRQIIAAAPNQKGDLAAELSVMAQDELKARYGSVEGIREPHMVGNKKAEERLLSAGMFTGRFKEQAAELDRKLRPLMTRLGLGDLHLNIVNAIRASNESTADGEYSKKLIKIAIDAEKPMRVLRHEGVHALIELGAFSKDQLRVLENKAKSEWISKYNIIERYQGLNLSPEALIEEAIADAFSDFDQTKPPAGLIGAVFNKIKSFMEALGNSLDGIGFHTADSIFSKVEAGRLPPTREPASMEVKNSVAGKGIKGETYNELNKTPEGAKVADLFLKHRAAEEKANKDRSMSQGRSEGEAARAFRRFNKALKEYTGNDEERQMKISGGLGTEQTLYDEAKDQGKFSLRETPKGEIHDELNKTPEGRKVIDLFVKHEVAEDKANNSGSVFRYFEGAATRAFAAYAKALRAYAGDTYVDDKSNFNRIDRGLAKEFELHKEAKAKLARSEKTKDEGKFSLREEPPKAKKEVKKRTMADLEKAIPPKDRVVSKDPTRLLNGEKFSDARLNEAGVGFLLSSIYGESKANEIIQTLWGESIKESGGDFAQNIISQVNAKPPTAAFLNAAMSLPNFARYWYETSGEAGADLPLTPDHIELLFNILSATSQNAKPLTNAKRAISVMAEYLQNRPIETDLISKKPVQDAINNPHLETLKFGNFANTFKFVTGLTKTAPISTNDRQVAVVFGMEPEVFVKNPVLYEVISRFYNKVRDQQNALLEKGEQPYEAWQLQALTWVEQRGDNTSYGTETSDDYVQALHAITEILKKEDIPLVGGKIGDKTLLDPRVPKILSGTLETFQNAMKATVESNTLLNTSGVAANAEYEKIENIQAPWANKLRKEFIQIQRRVLRKLASQKIVQDVVAAVVGGKVSMSRMDSTARGTYEDKLSPNMRIPMSYRDSKNAHHDLTDVESSAVLSILGNGLDQAAMAGSVFKPSSGGETFRVFFPGKIVSDAEASAFSAAVGFPLNIYEVPNGGVVEINVGGRDDRPTKDSITEANANIFPNNKAIVTQTSIKTVYLEKGKNSYGVPYYNEAINDYRIRKFGRGDPSGLGRRFDADIHTATKKIRQLTTERNKEFRAFTKDAREQQAKAAVRGLGKKPPSAAPPPVAPSIGKLSLRQTKTPEFKQWFRDSKQVHPKNFTVPDYLYKGVSDDEIIGSPKFWYHGTAQDIGTFKPKQANAIFLSPDPDFAESFSQTSEDYMVEKEWDKLNRVLRLVFMRRALLNSVSDNEISSAQFKSLSDDLSEERKMGNLAHMSFPKAMSLISGAEDALNSQLLERLPSRANIMPLYVRAENTFDYENPDHIKIIKPAIEKRHSHYTPNDVSILGTYKMDLTKIDMGRFKEAQIKNDIANIEKGRWQSIEYEDIQKAIKDAGFDSFYVEESGRKNLAVYSPNQVKSAVGNTGAFSRKNDDVKYSIRATSAQTKPQGRFDEANADLSPDMTAAINRTTTARKNEGWSDRIAAAFSPRSFTAFRQAFIHGADSISNLTRESALQFGEQEYHADRSAIAAVVFADRAAGIAASSFVNGPPVYKNGFASVPENSTVRGLIPILEPIMKGGAHMFQRFQFYAGTRRGSRLMYETRVGKDGKTITSTREQNFTKEDIERGKILEKMHPEFKQVFAEYQQYNNGLVQFMKDTGVISAKEAELWTKNWDYIPFYRQMDGDRINAPAIFSSISGVKKPKELKGGEAPLADFMETVIRNSRAAIEAGMKNVAGQRTIRDLQRLNQASEVPPATKGYDIVSIKQAGVTKFYKVDDSLVYEALKGLDAPHLPFVEILAKPANFLRDMVTKDPGFMLANLARDSMQAWVTSGVNMTPLFDTFKQAGKAMLGSNPEAAALARSGYFTGYDFAGDTKSSAAAVEKELRKRTGTQTAAEKALMPISKIMDILDKGAHISDLATRSEVYKRVLEETGNEAEATYQALEIMNFSRKGNSALIRIVTALVPFMNARIQGMDVLYRTGFGRSATVHNQKQKKLFATRSLTILGLTAMYLALAADTEEYKNATPEERDNYWILGGLGRIPIPFELGVLFKVFPERIYQHVWGMDTGADLRQSIARNVTSTLVMNPIPHVAMPIVENIANYSFFTGQPIVGKGMEDVYTPYQANPSTSLLAQLVGKETNQSPLKIDNLIRGYTGTIGTYAVMMLDAAMRGEGDDVKATKKLEQMPVFKRFMTTKQGSGTINAYYELKKEVDTAVKTVNFLERQGDYDELAVFQAGRGGKLLGIKDYIKGLDEEMSSLRTFRREARRSKMDPDNLAEIESNIKDAEINVTKNIQFVKKALD